MSGVWRALTWLEDTVGFTTDLVYVCAVTDSKGDGETIHGVGFKWKILGIPLDPVQFDICGIKEQSLMRRGNKQSPTILSISIVFDAC